jgi:hypothetical protein
MEYAEASLLYASQTGKRENVDGVTDLDFWSRYRRRRLG